MSEKSLALRLALFAAIVAISAAPLFSQALYGCVVGTVTHQSSVAVLSATVTLTNVGTGDGHQSKSGAGRQIQAGSTAATNATDVQVINDVPIVTQNPLSYMLKNGVQPRNETSTSTLGDL